MDKPIEPQAINQPEKRYSFSKPKVLGFSALFIVLALLFLWIAYDLSDPDWRPTGRRMRNALINDMLLMMPWWVRGAVFGALSLVVALLSGCLLFHAFDRRPDFIIRPEGVQRNLIFRIRSLSWSEIQCVNIKESTIKIIGPPTLKSYGENTVIEFDRGLFSAAARGEVLSLIRHYRPDLIIDEQASQH